MFTSPVETRNTLKMKIQCDVCNKEVASVFCSADEAALCDGCDHRVHHANKLASKHHRFSLLNPSHKEFPTCDICQERRAFVFCREDRAILCRECDLPIHTANEHTQKHSRFLLTGVKLSSNTLIPTTTTSSSNGCDASVDSEISNKNCSQPLMKVLDPPPPSIKSTSSSGGGGSTSSISEYLMEMLPGWHVEDFFDSSSASRHHQGYCKTDELSQILDSDIESKLGCFPSDNIAVWVPQAPVPIKFPQIESQKNTNGLFKELNEVINMSPNSNNNNNNRWVDHGFTVPQISPPSNNKRSRHLW